MVEIRGGSSPPTASPSPARRSGRPTSTARPSPSPRRPAAPDGRFTIRLPKPADRRTSEGYLARFPWLARLGPGLRARLGRARPAGRPAGRAGRHARRGRDADRGAGRRPRRPARRRRHGPGRPASGSTSKGDLAGWIARARNGAAGNLWQGLREPAARPRSSPIEATDRARRPVQLTGIGRDRIADLLVSGPGIATTQVNVFGPRRAGDPGHRQTG